MRVEFVMALSETRKQFRCDGVSYYIKQVSAPSEDYNTFYRTGDPGLYEINGPDGLVRLPGPDWVEDLIGRYRLAVMQQRAPR